MKRPENITAAMIAEKLDLSRTTVSLVLSGRAKAHRISDHTAERVLAAARAMRYRPNAAAQQLAGKRSNAIGVLVTSELMIDLRLIETMERLAAERGIRFIVGHAIGSTERVRDYLGDFLARGVDGLFSFFHHHPDHRTELMPDLLRFQNVVYYERPVDADGTTPPGVCFAGPDFFEVGRLGVQHLVDRGRQRIGLLFRESGFPYALERRRACEQVLAGAGRTMDPRLMWVMTERTGRPWTDVLSPELALRVVDDLVLDEKVDGIVAVNDLYAASLVGALRRRGLRVPDDVAVVGCDNLELGSFIDPPLTTIDLRLSEVAKVLTDMMWSLLDRRWIPEDRRAVHVTPELIVRESS